MGRGRKKIQRELLDPSPPLILFDLFREGVGGEKEGATDFSGGDTSPAFLQRHAKSGSPFIG